jgi:hypothetical protein
MIGGDAILALCCACDAATLCARVCGDDNGPAALVDANNGDRLIYQ